MRSSQTFSISFFARKKKKQPELALLYARVTVNSKSLEISLKRTVPVNRWSQSAGKMLGNGSESYQINKKLDETRTLLYKAYDDLLKQDQVITAHLIKDRFLGTDRKHHTLLYLSNYHNQKMSGVFKYGTMKNYFTTENYLKEWLFRFELCQ